MNLVYRFFFFHSLSLTHAPHRDKEAVRASEWYCWTRTGVYNLVLPSRSRRDYTLSCLWWYLVPPGWPVGVVIKRRLYSCDRWLRKGRYRITALGLFLLLVNVDGDAINPFPGDEGEISCFNCLIKSVVLI